MKRLAAFLTGAATAAILIWATWTWIDHAAVALTTLAAEDGTP